MTATARAHVWLLSKRLSAQHSEALSAVCCDVGFETAPGAWHIQNLILVECVLRTGPDSAAC